MNIANLPEVRINFSQLLYQDVSKKLNRLNEWDLPSAEQCEKWAESYRNEWAKKEKTILIAMQEILDLRFYKTVIDVALAPDIIGKSDPLIIGFIDRPKGFVDTLTHELTHVLLTDNTKLSLFGSNRKFMLGSEWRKLFGFEDDFDALVHVPVHAVQKKIFIEVLNDENGMQRDKDLMKKFKADSYLKSWDYVDEIGYDVIIDKLKKSYDDIADQLGKKK